MTGIRVALVDVYPLRVTDGQLEVLVLRRAAGARCTGAWEVVHGHIEAGETPADAGRRELREETGLTAERLFNLSRVELFYQHRVDEVALVPAFAAVVGAEAEITLSTEHDAARWLAIPEAAARLAWPRSIRALGDIGHLLPGGQPGPVRDVLEVT
ncbi:MAG TPA: NUDIX domain-containing protein [Gemmatimonadales bacterium]|nr:NUDIX domain-containing protein [Gemmatimonadales bacterium]